MKNSIKLIAIALFVALGTNSYAQKLGLTAGINYASLSIKDNPELEGDFQMKQGFQMGPTLSLRMDDDRCQFEVGLLYSQKGYKLDQVQASTTPEITHSQVNTETSLHYLEIPIGMRRDFNRGKVKVFMSMGGYMGIGLSGKTTGKTTETSSQNVSRVVETHEDNISWGSDAEDYLNRTDLGLQMGGGMEYKALQLRMNYSMGLTNLAPAESDNGKIHNRVMSVSLAYLFLR